jgi:hypothetical protein
LGWDGHCESVHGSEGGEGGEPVELFHCIDGARETGASVGMGVKEEEGSRTAGNWIERPA